MKTAITMWAAVWAWLAFVQAFAGVAASLLCGLSMLIVVALVAWEDRNLTSKGSSHD